MKKIVVLYSFVLWKCWGTIAVLSAFYQPYMQTQPSSFHMEQHPAWIVKFDQLKHKQNKAR